MEEYNQRNAEIPEAIPILASGISSSSTRAAIDLAHSTEQEAGVEERTAADSGKTCCILVIGQENSNAGSLS